MKARTRGRLCLIALILLVVISWMARPSAALRLDNRRIEITSSAVGQTNVNYDVFFDLTTAGTMGSVMIEFCSNDPYPNTPCTPPTNFDDSAAILVQQTGETGFTIHSSSTSNKLVLSRIPVAAVAGSVSYAFNGITNPTTLGTYYVRLLTFASNDATGPPIDIGGIAMTTVQQLNISAEVPPYLEFCSAVIISSQDCSNTSGNFTDLGNLVPSNTGTMTSQFLGATNAIFGYNVYINGTTLTAGNNVIPALSTPAPSQKGNSQFGINLHANSAPPIGQALSGSGNASADASYNLANLFTFNDGDTLASTSGASDFNKFTVSYIVNVNTKQPPGQYVTTLTYICLASF
ncbi:MAG: hypothetical protein JWS12_913 [Candidatus Saccharibacteria bacterium]|nr:hypothetical protein [Candidatus Saccharibacteria bacterium]